MLIPFKEIIEKYGIQPKGVVHIGANYGQEAKDYIDNGVEDIVWIEANPQNLDILVQNLMQYPNFNPFHIVNACVSDKDDQEVLFHIANNEGQSSSMLDLEYHKIAHQEVFYTETITLKTKTLNTIFKNFDLTKYTFLNADIQGAELLMLKGATEVLHHFNCLYLEVNEKELYKGCGLIGEIDEFLKPFGFNRVQTEWCGNFGWGDAIYLKSDCSKTDE